MISYVKAASCRGGVALDMAALSYLPLLTRSVENMAASEIVGKEVLNTY